MHLNWWEQKYKDILRYSTTPMNSACSGLSETYFSEEMGKLGETIKSIKLIVACWLRNYSLFTYWLHIEPLILFEKRDNHSELCLEGGMTEQK